MERTIKVNHNFQKGKYMNVVELSAMIQVRNHLQMLLNDRAAVPKQKLRDVQSVISDMDKKIVADALDSLTETAMGMSKPSEVKAATPVPPKVMMENKAVMVVQPEESLMDLQPARPIKLGAGGKKTKTPKPVETKANE